MSAEKLTIIRTIKEMNLLKDYLADKEYVTFDTETTGVTKEAEIIGFSVCAELDQAFYVILSYWDVKNQRLEYLETKAAAQEFLQSLINKRLIMHNAVFDCMIVEAYFKVSLIQSVFHDTMISGHLLDENRSNGLKERAAELYGEDSRKEQLAMKESVSKNGGQLTKTNYELYKADADLIAYYGAKDALLTLKLFYEDVEQLFAQGLDKFFYEDESMPLLRGPTYELNTTGLRVDADKLQKLRNELEAECLETKAFIYSEIDKHVKEKYPGTNKKNGFNIGSSKQLAWLLFIKLNNVFDKLTDEGREVCKALGMKLPYTISAKLEFIEVVSRHKGRIYAEAKWNPKTKKMGRPKKIGDVWNYLACGADALTIYAKKYKWAAKLLDYAKAQKLLNTYVIGIQQRTRYNIIHPSFLQHGTTSGRYSSRGPNFQNLPKGDKRVKACIVARPGKVFVGADYSQVEPRIMADLSGDETLISCFEEGKDFYSVVGVPVYEKHEASLFKDNENSFARLYPDLRDQAKVFSLAKVYGRTSMQQAITMKTSVEDAAALGERYFSTYPKVELMMLQAHEEAKANGVVYSLFGRPRRIPEAKNITKVYGNAEHAELPYVARTLLNLAVNHKIQSTGASIMNRASIAAWKDKPPNARIVLQVHDELVLECDEQDADKVVKILKNSMENTAKLQRVALVAEPKVAKNLADLK